MKETARTISDWAVDTFGEATSDLRVAARAHREFSELLTGMASGIPKHKQAEEIADVVIVLTRLSVRLGFDLFELIDRKMEVNRGRVWERDGTGCGQHVATNHHVPLHARREPEGEA